MSQGEVPAAEGALIYQALLFVVTFLTLRSFLRRELDGLLDDFPGNLSAFLLGFALWLALTGLVRRLPFPLENPLPFQWRQEYLFAPKVTVLLVVFLIPLTEEVFFRGLVFGALRGKSRILAYGVSCALFSLASVWRYALDLREAGYLLNALEYLPAALGLAWCYERGGSVWSAVALRVAMNGTVLLWLVGR